MGLLPITSPLLLLDEVNMPTMGSIACHWDLNELPVFEQQLEWTEPLIEMLGLQQLVDINQIYSASDAEVDVLLDERSDSSDSEEMQDLYEMAQQPCIDAFAFASNRYFAFDRAAYILMIASIKERQGVTIDSLKVVDKHVPLGIEKMGKIPSMAAHHHQLRRKVRKSSMYREALKLKEQQKEVVPEEAIRSGLKLFIKVVNYNPTMPTKYTLDVDLKNAVVPEKLDAKTKRVDSEEEEAKKDQEEAEDEGEEEESGEEEEKSIYEKGEEEEDEGGDEEDVDDEKEDGEKTEEEGRESDEDYEDGSDGEKTYEGDGSTEDDEDSKDDGERSGDDGKGDEEGRLCRKHRWK
ncbi:hypothetical protein L7F22_056805 [Adiantum nelumboides]|nr:hypothetical protein [Adiantum nelumboides]